MVMVVYGVEGEVAGTGREKIMRKIILICSSGQRSPWTGLVKHLIELG